MKPANPGVKLTYDDFLQFPEDGKRHELIDGEHCVTPAPIREHQAIVMNLGSLIWVYLQQHPIGRVFGSPLDVIFSHFDVVEPDVLFITHERMPLASTEIACGVLNCSGPLPRVPTDLMKRPFLSYLTTRESP